MTRLDRWITNIQQQIPSTSSSSSSTSAGAGAGGTSVSSGNKQSQQPPKITSFFTTTSQPIQQSTSSSSSSPASPMSSAAVSPSPRRGEMLNFRTEQIKEQDNIAAFRVTLSLLLAVADLHSQRIYHRDLKSSNVFFSLKGSCDSTIKLIDFAHTVLPASNSNWNARVSNLLQRKEFEKMRLEEQEKQQIQQPEDFKAEYVTRLTERSSTYSNTSTLSF